MGNSSNYNNPPNPEPTPKINVSPGPKFVSLEWPYRVKWNAQEAGTNCLYIAHDLAIYLTQAGWKDVILVKNKKEYRWNKDTEKFESLKIKVERKNDTSILDL